MDPNQIPFGTQTTNQPIDTFDDTQTTQLATGSNSARLEIEPSISTKSQPTANPEPLQKKKGSFPITIIIIAIVAAIAIIAVAIILSSSNNNTGQSQQDNSETAEVPTTEEPTVETEYAAKDRLTKQDYTAEDFNNGVTLDIEGNYTFTASPSVKLKHIATNSSALLQVYATHEDLKNIPVAIELAGKDIEELNKDCIKTKGCESDYIDGAKTLFLSETNILNKKTYTKYTFYSKSDNKLLKYQTVDSYTADSAIKETAMRNIMIKTAMTISGKSNKPYIYDLATFIKIPNNKRVKTYKYIHEVDHQFIKVSYKDSGNTNNIYIFLKRIEGVAITDVSQEPRIGSFTFYNNPGFRFYINDEQSIDIMASICTSNSKENFSKDYKKVQELIDKIEE